MLRLGYTRQHFTGIVGTIPFMRRASKKKIIVAATKFHPCKMPYKFKQTDQ